VKKVRCIILGGGISGLSLAWYLSKNPNCDLLLLEKENRLGGHLETKRTQDFLFETGPRIFKTSRSVDLLQLIEELGLASQIITTQAHVSKRYVWREGKLCPFPKKELLSILPALLAEWKKPSYNDDESIWDFALRRFNQKTAELLFDPMVVGIYAGDLKKLSIESCFPLFKQWEKEFGSLTKGFFYQRKKKGASGLFSLQGGTQTLIDALEKTSSARIVRNQKIQELQFSSSGAKVITHEQSWDADFVFSALPAHELNGLLPDLFPKIDSQGMVLVNVGYHKNIGLPQGFGYLIPSTENHEVLGAVFDSNLFEENSEQTRLTFMLKEGENAESKTRKALQEHLKILTPPDFLRVVQKPLAIPQFEVGHAKKIEELKQKLAVRFPLLHLTGNYLKGVSVSDAIQTSKQVAEEFLKTLHH
jgi:oxygen-dependent protoporphyrinogen oxidase